MGCFVMAFYGWGIGFYGHGFYIVVLGASTGWPTATLSSAVAGFWLANVAASLTLGRLIDRFGVRPAIFYGTFAMAGGCFGLAAFETGLLDAPWQLFAIFLVMGSAYPGLAAMAVSATLIPWFKGRLGLALGIGLSGASGGGAVMPPLMAYLSGAYGFGAAMTAIGIALLLSVLPIAVFLIRRSEIGEAAREFGQVAADTDDTKPPLGYFLRDTRFWLITLAAGLSLGAQVRFLMHQIPLLQGPLGLSRAALAVSVAALSSGVGRFVLGALSGRLPLTLLAIACYLIQAVGIALFLVTDLPALLFVASAIAGFVIGCIVMLPPLLLVDSFGSRGYGTGYGLIGATMFVMGSIATAASGWLHDVTGAYRWPLIILTGLHVMACLLILWHGRRRRRQAH